MDMNINSPQINMLWKSTVYVLSLRISVPVYLRLIVTLLNPHGIHIYDGPGFLSRQLKQETSLILLSTFQTFIAIYTLSLRHISYEISYGSIMARETDVLVMSNQFVAIPPCKTHFGSRRNITKKSQNKYCVYILRADTGYVNLSITKMTYNGPNYNKTTPVPEHGTNHEECLQGGLSYEIFRTDSHPKLQYLCNNYGSKYYYGNDSNHKSFIDIISSSSSMLLVVYSYEYYSDIFVNATITTSVCIGVPKYGGSLFEYIFPF